MLFWWTNKITREGVLVALQYTFSFCKQHAIRNKAYKCSKIQLFLSNPVGNKNDSLFQSAHFRRK